MSIVFSVAFFACAFFAFSLCATASAGSSLPHPAQLSFSLRAYVILLQPLENVQQLRVLTSSIRKKRARRNLLNSICIKSAPPSTLCRQQHCVEALCHLLHCTTHAASVCGVCPLDALRCVCCSTSCCV